MLFDATTRHGTGNGRAGFESEWDVVGETRTTAVTTWVGGAAFHGDREGRGLLEMDRSQLVFALRAIAAIPQCPTSNRNNQRS
jgi:hypothetical protein